MSRNIKEIGKELMGKSLNSFHRKTGLTQLEENNKMQDGILNGILSQVDDAYIQKTEQSNVIHLDGSGDGIVVLDGIEGNTMVNLANSDLATDTILEPTTDKGRGKKIVEMPLNSPSNYTLIVNVKECNISNATYGGAIKLRIHYNDSTEYPVLVKDTEQKVGIYKHLISSKTGINKIEIYVDGVVTGQAKISELMLLEGDWTDKETPTYFKGLQSSFEEKINDESKYEIEILMKNKNLIDVFQSVDENVKGIQCHMEDGILNLNGASTGQADFNYIPFSHEIHLLKGKEYRLNFEILSSENSYNLYCRCAYKVTKRDGTIQWLGGTIEHPLTSYIINGDEVEKVSRVRMYSSMEGAIFNNFKVRCQLEISDTSTTYEKPKQNKIKLLLNSPLLKGDKLVVKDGKLQHYHKMKQMKITDRSQLKYMGTYPTNEGYLCKHFNLLNTEPPKPYTDCYCDNISVLIPKGDGYSALSYTPSLAIAYQGMLYVTAKISDYAEPIDYLLAKTPTIVYELAEPYYEEVLNEYGEPVMLEGYENGTVYIDSVITPTTTLRYTPKMESLKTLKAVNHNNIMLTDDINNNIIDYMMNVDLMIMEKEMQITKTRRIGEKDMTNMQKRTFDMLKRLIKGKTLTEQECKDRVVLYLSAEKITSEQAEELMLYISEIYA